MNPAQVYQEKFVPLLFAPWTHELLDRTAPQPGNAILDVACGTGIVTRDAAARLEGEGRVVGLDINPAMLDVARLVDSPYTHLIEWRQASVEHLPFADASFDVVLCQQAFQFFPDKELAAQEMSRVLKPGGRAAILVWSHLEHFPAYQLLNDTSTRLFGFPAFAAPFSFPSSDALATTLSAGDFSDIRIESIKKRHVYPDPDGFLAVQVAASASVLPQMRDMTPEDLDAFTAALEAEVRTDLDHFLVDGQYVFEGIANLALAVR